MMMWFSELSIGLRIEIILAIIFVLLLSWYLWKNRKHVVLQKILFPLLYIFMLRRKWGLGLMDLIARKYRRSVRFFGYVSIGVAFIAMGFMIWLFVQIGIWLFTEPAKAALAPVLPFLTLPGIGFLGFTHWLLAIAFLVIVHEFAHGMVARAHGVRVKSSGIAVLGLIVPIFPAAFVEPDTKQMQKKKDWVQHSILAAGPVMNIVFFLLFWVILLFVMNPALNAMTEPVGFSYTVINDTPAAAAGLAEFSLVNYYEGEQVTDANIVVDDLFYEKTPGQSVVFGYYNVTSNELTVANVTTTTHPDDPSKAYVGINNIINQQRFTDGFRPYAPYMLWLHGLIKWLVLFNLLVGIFNTLPLVITDGGQMFLLALSRVIGRPRAAKVTGFLGLVFGAIILAGIGVWIGGFF
jgi:hypothetical protein